MSGYCDDCGNTACLCAAIALGEGECYGCHAEPCICHHPWHRDVGNARPLYRLGCDYAGFARAWKESAKRWRASHRIYERIFRLEWDRAISLKEQLAEAKAEIERLYDLLESRGPEKDLDWKNKND